MRFRFKTYKLKRRRKHKQKGKGFANSLGNFWNIWWKGLGGWEGKKIMQWWNLMFQKELPYQKRISREELPPNIVMCRTYVQRAVLRGRRRRQRGRGICDFVKKVTRNPLVKSLAKKGIVYGLGIYHNLTKWVKKKTLSRILNSDAAHLALNKAIKTANNHLQWIRE